MHKFKIRFVLLFFFIVPIYSDSDFSVMTLNVNNLFDELDDPKKDDKAYLPIELKKSKKHIDSCMKIRVNSWKNECLNLDWDKDTKNAKLNNIARDIVAYDSDGPDIIALQEVENENILIQLFNLIESYGYIDYVLIDH